MASVNSSRLTDHHRNPAFLPTEGAKSTRPFANCSMDLITDLPPADGHDSILVVVDQGLSKGVILTTLQQNAHFWRHGTTPIGELIQTIRTSWQDYFRSRTPICFQGFCGASKTSWHQIGTVNCLSSPDGRNYRTCQPRDRSIPVNLLRFPSRRMASGTTHLGVYAQQPTTCRSTLDSLWTYVRRITIGDTLVLRKHEISSNRRTNDYASMKQRRSLGSTRVG